MKNIYFNFLRSCNKHAARIEQIRSKRENMDEWEFNRLTESLMSDMWQSWCFFCRNLLMRSCRGATPIDNSLVRARYNCSVVGYNSWKRIGYEASKRKCPHKIKDAGHSNFYMRNEPTWGDLNIIIEVIQVLNPSNGNHLLDAFGCGRSLKHLQLARNACAHKNVELIQDLNREMRPYYKYNKIRSPSELSWCLKRTENVFAIFDWLYEMKQIAKEATRKN